MYPHKAFWGGNGKTLILSPDHSCIVGISFLLYTEIADSFYPGLTLDYKTSLSSPTNTSPWFVSSTHIDPWVLHTNVWDHQVPCAKHLDSLHADGTAVCSGEIREKAAEKDGKEFTAGKIGTRSTHVQHAFGWSVEGEKGKHAAGKIRVANQEEH